MPKTKKKVEREMTIEQKCEWIGQRLVKAREKWHRVKWTPKEAKKALGYVIFWENAYNYYLENYYHYHYYLTF